MHSLEELSVYHHVLGEQLNHVAARDDHEPLLKVISITFGKSALVALISNGTELNLLNGKNPGLVWLWTARGLPVGRCRLVWEDALGVD